MASSAVQPSLKGIRHDLKQWEHSFFRLHGRSPSKDDIKASPSIRALYRQYACLKVKEQTRAFTSSENGDSNMKLRKNTDLHTPALTPHHPVCVRPTNCAIESSESSQGSHISATPPRKKSSTCSIAEVSSTKTETPCNTRRTVLGSRPILGEITNTLRVSKKLRIEEALVNGCDQIPENDKSILGRNGNVMEIPPYKDLLEDVSKCGFTIKVQRHGARDKENCEIQTIPAGFCLQGTSLAKTLSTKILARESHPNSGHTLDCSETRVSESEQKAMAKSSNGLDEFPLQPPHVVNLQSGICSQGPSCEGSLGEVKALRDSEMTRLSKITVPKLRHMLLNRGLSSNGNKSQLISRLTEASCSVERDDLESSTFSASDGVASHQAHFDAMTVVALRKLLSTKGLAVRGTKAELIARLLQDTEGPNKEAKRPARKTGKGKNEVGSSDEMQNMETLEAHSEQAEGSRNLNVRNLASKRSKSTVEFINWHSARGTNCLTKKSATRENFVKLNMGKRGYKSYRFINTVSKRKFGVGKHRFRRYTKQKSKKRHNANTEERDDRCVEHECSCDNGKLQQDLDSSLLVKSTEASQNGEQSKTKNEVLDQGVISVPLTLAAAEALKDPTKAKLQSFMYLLLGYKSFRSGQLETIQRVLAGQDTMLVLPTGGGKSLTYQLPAFLLPGLTLVISPLVSVMVDQFQHLPPCLPGAVLSSFQTSKEYASIMDRVQSSKVKVLFISPERLQCDNFLSLLQGLPHISLAVVDEAHCLSEWSHNFRPSYYRLGAILRYRLKLGCVLAMTATATKRTLCSIMETLSIEPCNLVQTSPARKNLICTARFSDNRCRDLLACLLSPPYKDATSIIVYCSFQLEADNVSLILRDNGINAKSYHGGMSPADRKHTQELFCSNKLRVVVATVAFGMGLDKSDVQAVIHYGMPNSLEHYVQETGRAGRNGDPAHCHLLLDKTNYLKLRSLAFSHNVDVSAMEGLLTRIFSHSSQNFSSEIRWIPIESATKDLDLKEEVVCTTLSYLEIGDVQYLSVLPQLKTLCHLQFHQKSPTHLARNSLLMDAVLKRSQEKHGEFIFDLPSVANYMGLKLPELQQQLQDLQVAGEVSFTLKDPSWCFHVLKVPEDLSAAAWKLTERFAFMENIRVKKLDTMFQAAMELIMEKEVPSELQSVLQTAMEVYFQAEEESLDCNPPGIIKYRSAFLNADLKVFLQSNSTASFSSRAIARIFHGISSPAYPATIWSQNHFWGRYKDTDFCAIKKAALQLLGGK